MRSILRTGSEITPGVTGMPDIARALPGLEQWRTQERLIGMRGSRVVGIKGFTTL